MIWTVVRHQMDSFFYNSIHEHWSLVEQLHDCYEMQDCHEIREGTLKSRRKGLEYESIVSPSSSHLCYIADMRSLLKKSDTVLYRTYES